MPTRSVTLRILGDDLSARSALDWVNAESDKIDSREPTLKIGADASPAMGKMAALRAAVAALVDQMHSVDFSANDAEFNAKLAAMLAKLTSLQAIANRPILSNNMLAKTKADVLGLASAFDRLTASQQGAIDSAHQAALDESHLSALADQAARGAAHLEAVNEAHVAALAINSQHDSTVGTLPGFKGAGGFKTGGLFGLNATIPLFGGLAATSGWHVAFDSLIELGAKLGPSLIALGAFSAALTALGPTAAMIYQRETAMYTATDVLHQNMYGLNGSLNAVNQQFKPGVIQVWGDALHVANNGSGTLVQLLQMAVPWVDRFAARMAIDLTNGTGTFMKVVRQGAVDLGQLGGILRSIGSAFVNLIKVSQETHIADDLFAVIGVAAKVLDWVTRLPVPLLAVVAGLHGIYLWGGLAVNGLSKIAGVIGGIPGLGGVKALSDLPKLFEDMATKGLAAKTGLDFAVKGFKGVAQDAEGATVKTGLFKTGLAALSEVPVWGWVAAGVIAVAAIGLAFLNTTSDAQRFADTLNTKISRASNADAFNVMAAGVGSVNNQLKTMPGVSQAASKAISSVGTSSKTFYDQVGIGVSQAIAEQQSYQSENQKIIGQMTSFSAGVGWIMKQFGVSYPIAIDIATKAGVKLTDNLTGNSKASEVLRQQIMGLMQGYQQLQGPSGIAGKDFEALAISANDITKKIQTLNSAWQQMTQAVTGPQTSLDTFAQGLTVLSTNAAGFSLHLGKLTVKGTEAKAAIDDLSTSGINLNQAFMQEVGNLDSYIGSLRTAGAPQEELTRATKAGVAALIPYAAGSKEATATLSLMAQQVDGPTTDSIKALSSWAGVKAPGALKVMKGEADKATVAASNLANALQNLLNIQFENDVIQATGASKALQAYTTDLVHNRDQTRQGRSDRQQLITDLEVAGMSAQRATSFVDGLSTSLGRIPKQENVQVSLDGKGQYQITGEVGTGGSVMAPVIGAGGGRFFKAARGMLVSGGIPGVDSVPILAQEGEAVVPRSLVPAVAPLLMHHGVPGFAAGGIIGGGSYSGPVQGLGPFANTMYGNFNHDMILTAVSQMKNAVSNLSQMFSGSGGGSGVSRWASVILEALSLLHQPAGLLGDVEHRMGIESGGNPTVVNRWDSNWIAGTPSVGLMQVIGPTFSAYAGPFRGVGPFEYGVSVNPLANTYAGLSYALGAYGSIAAAMMKSGGYANGGVITEPMFAMGASGRGLWLGERGPELVTPLNRVSSNVHGGSDGNIYVVVNAGDCVDPNAVAQAIWQNLRRLKKKKGNVPLGLD